ncbi:Spy/CpxP family protein refolding chaperone [Mycobacterium sp. MAA66]|uniref:hypothetical protein n=1 Tax=Mycobacterium sp. MAA66 TaxID=3156297 RepID=UPI003514C498
MKVTPHRTAALICAGAIAFAMTALPVAAADASTDHLPTAVTASSTGDSTYAPVPTSPFANHGAVG